VFSLNGDFKVVLNPLLLWTILSFGSPPNSFLFEHQR